MQWENAWNYRLKYEKEKFTIVLMFLLGIDTSISASPSKMAVAFREIRLSAW